MKKYWVNIYYCLSKQTPGNKKYGMDAEFTVPIQCAENRVTEIATAIGKGYLADNVVVYDVEDFVHQPVLPILIVKESRYD